MQHQASAWNDSTQILCVIKTIKKSAQRKHSKILFNRMASNKLNILDLPVDNNEDTILSMFTQNRLMRRQLKSI